MRRGCRDDDRLPQTYGVEKLMGEEMDRQSSGQGVMYRDPIDAVERDVSLSSELIDSASSLPH